MRVETRKLIRVKFSLLLGWSLAGCAEQTTRFHIVDYRDAQQVERYSQSFDQCYYRHDPAGNLDVVIRRSAKSDDGQPVTQLIHMRTFWRVQPGRTYAESSMINATVSYLISSWSVGAAFEGSGFLSFKTNRRRDRIDGRLELSFLTPQRRLGQADKLFERAELSGEFSAELDEAKVVSILNEMTRLFGPLPDYIPPATDPDY